MKKLTLNLLTVLLTLTFSPILLKAGSEATPNSTIVIPYVESTHYKAMIERVNEIKAMDKSSLTSSDRKALRKELRTIKKELKANDGGHNGGIYISVGGLLLIIILLIIFL